LWREQHIGERELVAREVLLVAEQPIDLAET
jgi:hypothetical protein